MCKDLFPRINRIRELIPITMSYNMITGESIFFSDIAGEWQVSCHVHGYDRRPSARIYDSSGKIYCFVCNEAWDTVGYYMAYNGLTWKDRDALQNMVKMFESNFDITGDDLEQYKIKEAVTSSFSNKKTRARSVITKDYHKLFESLWYHVNDYIITSSIADKDKYYKFMDIMWDNSFKVKDYKEYWETLQTAFDKLKSLDNMGGLHGFS